MSTTDVALSHVANVLIDFLIIPFGTTLYDLTDNKVQFRRKLIATICIMLDVSHLTRTSYYLKINGQNKRYNQTKITQLQHYVTKNQKDWHICMQILPYKCYAKVQRCTKTFCFNLVLTRHWPGLIEASQPGALATDSDIDIDPWRSNLNLQCILPQNWPKQIFIGQKKVQRTRANVMS